MHRRPGSATAGGALSLLVAAPACAHGGLGSLGALQAALLALTGLIGLVVLAFLIPAVRSAIRNDRAGTWTVVALVLGAAYAVISLFLFFASRETGVAKFPGAIAFVVVALLCLFFLRHHGRQRNLALSVIAIVGAVLMLMPAKTWKGNPFDLVERVFVDNTAELVELPWNGDRDSLRQLLVTADGREILQFNRDADIGDAGGLYGELPGERVTLKPVDTGRQGDWYQVSHYVIDPRYEAAKSMPWDKPRHSLFKRKIDMYQPTGQHSIGVRLDTSAGIDFEAMLLEMLSRSGTRSLKHGLVDAGGINVRRQAFIDKAFEHRYGEAYSFLLSEGLDVNATASDGESMLHRAADIADVRLMKHLVDRGADRSARNAAGRTPFEHFLQKHAQRPIAMRPFRATFPEVVVP